VTTPRPRLTTVTARSDDTPGADTAPADFFVPCARYYDGDGYAGPEQTHTFQCEHVTTHPRPGAGLPADAATELRVILTAATTLAARLTEAA
jgi:hypothetical protein